MEDVVQVIFFWFFFLLVLLFLANSNRFRPVINFVLQEPAIQAAPAVQMVAHADIILDNEEVLIADMGGVVADMGRANAHKHGREDEADDSEPSSKKR